MKSRGRPSRVRRMRGAVPVKSVMQTISLLCSKRPYICHRIPFGSLNSEGQIVWHLDTDMSPWAVMFRALSNGKFASRSSHIDNLVKYGVLLDNQRRGAIEEDIFKTVPIDGEELTRSET